MHPKFFASVLILFISCLGISESALPGVFSVRSFGAIGDTVADDTSSFQAAIDEAFKTGGTVFVDPVSPGQGYVLTHTVILKQGVSLVGSFAGMPFIAWEGVPRKMQTGPVILARPASAEYVGPEKKPLFQMEGGNTLRGLYILYDQQPWPSDEEFDREGSLFYHKTLEEITSGFIKDHVMPYGPTITVRPGVASTTIEDITCGRYWDFFYTAAGGKIVIRRCYLYGYNRAFALREARDVVRISEIHIVPNIEEPISWQHAKLHAAITARPENIAFDFGSVDGYSVNDVAVFLCHTGFKLGATEGQPLLDPQTGEKASFPWGLGPWGSMQNVKLDNCVVGVDCVNGTILPNQLSNIMVHVSIDTPERFHSTQGDLARQAAFVLGPGFVGATLQINNLSLSSFSPLRVVATGKMVHEANGRAFLLDCPPMKEPKDYAQRQDAHVEIFGLVVSNIPDSHLYAVAEGTRSSVRMRGFVHNGVNREDCEFSGAR